MDIEAGEHIAVTYDLRASTRVLVTFAHWAAKPPRKPVYRRFAEAHGIGFVGFVARQNNWWQSREFPLALKRVDRRLAGYGERVLFGTSMGGHGALLASGYLKATRVVTAAPQMSINREIVPWEKRWKKEAAGLQEYFDRAHRRVTQGAPVIVFHDPAYRWDRPHIALLRRHCPGLTCIPLTGARHTPLDRLNVSDEVLEALLLRGDIGFAQSQSRAAWRHTPARIAALAFARYGQRRPACGLAWLDKMIGAVGPHPDLTAMRARLVTRLS